MNPLISIIMPTFNHDNYLSRSINSVLEQEFQNWELIIIDNYSIDCTQQIINSYMDLRIKYFKFNNNGIIAKSRNFGINKSNGDWIAFLDSDDWWNKNKLYECVNLIDRDVDFIYHKLIIFKKKKNIYSKCVYSRALNKKTTIDLIENGNPIPASSVILRKNLFIDVGCFSENKDLVGIEDYHAWIKLSLKTNKFLYINSKLGYYTIHENNISNKDFTNGKITCLNEFLRFIDNKKLNLILSKIKYESFLSNKYISKSDFFFVMFHSRFMIKIKFVIYFFYYYLYH